MKRALILHGTGGSPEENWFGWLKAELENQGYEVWVPLLPNNDHPDTKTYDDFLLNSDWNFQNNLIIGHSSGSVEILSLLQALPDDTIIDTAILVGSFEGDLGRDDLKGMDKEFDLDKIKSKATQFIVVHSDNDPYCPLDGAKSIASKLGVSVTLMPGMYHFGMAQDPRFIRFPELLEIIKEEVKL